MSENLITVHDSVGFLTKLKILTVVVCSKLIRFSPLNLNSLERLKLSNCSSLEEFQRFTTGFKVFFFFFLFFVSIFIIFILFTS